MLFKQFIELYAHSIDEYRGRINTAILWNSESSSHVHFEETLYNVSEKEALESQIAAKFSVDSFHMHYVNGVSVRNLSSRT